MGTLRGIWLGKPQNDGLNSLFSRAILRVCERSDFELVRRSNLDDYQDVIKAVKPL